MATINISEADSISYKDFQQGNPVQVRAVAAPGQEHDFDKGRKVTISHLNMETVGEIVSDPIEISSDGSGDSNRKVLSVVIQKPN